MLSQNVAELSLFDGFSEAQLSNLFKLLEMRRYEKDQLIFEQGQKADYLYILLKGDVSIRYKPYDGPPLTVARITPGGVFGWSTAMGRTVYTSAAVAVSELEVLRISGQRLQHLCEDCPDTGAALLERLASGIAERLRNTHSEILNILSLGMDLNQECLRRINQHE